MELLNVGTSHSHFFSTRPMHFCSNNYGIAQMSISAGSSNIYHYNSADCEIERAFSTVIGEDTSAVNDNVQLPIFGLPSHASNVPINNDVCMGQQASFSCPQFSSSLLPCSDHLAHFQPAEVELTRNVRRPNWTCPECRRRFDKYNQFQAHFEPCWVNAVEREHQQQQTMERFETSPPSEEQHTMPLVQSYRLGADGCSRTKTDFFIGKAKKTKLEDCVNSNYDEIADVGITAKSVSEKVECPVCGKRLFRHNLHVHHRIHTGELPFPCAFCPKRFRTSSARRVHHWSHTGEKPYLCSFCQYACTTKRNLERHVHNRHLPIHIITEKSKETE